MRVALGSAILATALLGSAHADGDALEDMLGPREIAVGEAMRGGAIGASAIGMNPAGLPLNRELVFEAGYGYRVADQASLIGVSACDSTSGVAGCFFYDYAGTSPELSGMTMHRTTHVGGFSGGYPLTPRVLVGSTVKYFHTTSDVMSEGKQSGVTWDLGTTVRLTDVLSVGVAGYNLFGSDAAQFPRAVGGGFLARPSGILGISFDARWRTEGEQRGARYGGGAELFLRAGRNGYPLRIGALHDNALGASYISGGIGMATVKFAFDVGGRKSLSGPDDTLVIASLRFYGPRQPAPAIAASPE
jgi:hypothetical protein